MTRSTADVVDLAAVAAAHPVRVAVLDLAKLDAERLLSVGDVVDMAEALGTDPAELTSVLKRPGRIRLEVGVVLAWIIGRKAEPELQLEEVRRSWRIEMVGEGTVDPRDARAETTRPSGRRRTSSRSRG